LKKVPPLDSPSKTFKKEEDKLPFESFARFEREYFFINKNTPAKRFIKVFAGFLRGLFSKSALKRGFPAHAEHGACGPLTSLTPWGKGAEPLSNVLRELKGSFFYEQKHPSEAF